LTNILDAYGQKMVAEERGYISGSSNLRNPTSDLLNAFNATDNDSNVVVTPETMLGISAFWCAVYAISSDIGLMQKNVKHTEDGGDRVVVDTHDPIAKLLNKEPNQDMDAMDFWSAFLSHALAWGGGFAEIVRDGAGQPTSLELIDPTTVTIWRDELGKIVYRVILDLSTGRDKSVILDDTEMFHVIGLSYNGISGYPLAQIARNAMGIAIASQSQSGTFFENGMTPSGILEHPGIMGDEAFRRLRKSFSERYAGSANSGKPLLLEEGTKWTQLGVDPEKAQMTESQQFSIENVARWFRIPPSKLMHLLKANFNTLEMQHQEYYDDTLLPWVTKLEEQAERKLLTHRPDNYFIQLDMSSKLRGDQDSRSKYYKERFTISSMSSNEVRKREGENPSEEEGANNAWIQMAMAPSEELYKQATLTTQLKEVELEVAKFNLEALKNPPAPEPEPTPQLEKEPTDEDPVENNNANPRNIIDGAPEKEKQTRDATEVIEDQELCVEFEFADNEQSDNSAEKEKRIKIVAAIVESSIIPVTSAYRRLLHAVADKARRAHKRGDLQEWASEFFDQHREYAEPIISEPLEACIRAIAVATDTEYAPENYDVYVREYIDLRMGQYLRDLQALVTGGTRENLDTIENCADSVASRDIENLIELFGTSIPETRELEMAKKIIDTVDNIEQSDNTADDEVALDLADLPIEARKTDNSANK